MVTINPPTDVVRWFVDKHRSVLFKIKMLTSQLLSHYRILRSFHFHYRISACSQFLGQNDVCVKYNFDSHRHYHLHQPTKLLFRNGNQFGKRNLSTDQLVSMQRDIFTYLSECSGTNYLKELVVSVHDITGLPWWATIIFTTIILRALITLPLAAYQASIIAKIENISVLEMPDIAKQLQKETTLKARQLKWTAPKANMYYKRNIKKHFNELIVRDNCHPFKSIITVWFQLPTWIFLSSALRNLAYMLPERNAAAEILFLQLSVGGFLWIPNLTQPDGLLICPVILGLSNLAIIEIQAMMRLREPTKLQRYATNFFRGFSVLLIPISATVPSVLCLYWTTSSIVGLCQNLFLMSNRVRKALRIPDTPSTHDYPYQQLIYEIKEKNRRLFSFITRKK